MTLQELEKLENIYRSKLKTVKKLYRFKVHAVLDCIEDLKMTIEDECDTSLQEYNLKMAMKEMRWFIQEIDAQDAEEYNRLFKSLSL